MRAQKLSAIEQIGAQLSLIQIALQYAAIVIIAGITADWEQPIGCQCQKAIDGGSARHVFNIGIQSAIFVHDQNCGKWPGARWLHEIAAHRAGIAAR